jgi:hypothetical protein
MNCCLVNEVKQNTGVHTRLSKQHMKSKDQKHPRKKRSEHLLFLSLSLSLSLSDGCV